MDWVTRARAFVLLAIEQQHDDDHAARQACPVARIAALLDSFERGARRIGRRGGATREDGEGDDVRNAALGSLRNDPGLHQLVSYFASWGGEQVCTHFRIDER